MTSIRTALALAAMFVTVGVAQAAVDRLARETDLPHVCLKGTNEGQPCILQANPWEPGAHEDCPGGTCVLAFSEGKGTKFSGELTFVVDDDSGNANGEGEDDGVVTASVILEVKKQRLTQSFVNLSTTPMCALAYAGAPTDPFGVVLTENLLADLATPYVPGDPAFANKAKVVENLVSRMLDNEMAEALRVVLGGPSGTPVIVSVSFKSDGFTDGRTGVLASVLTVKVKGQFVAQQ